MTPSVRFPPGHIPEGFRISPVDGEMERDWHYVPPHRRNQVLRYLGKTPWLEWLAMKKYTIEATKADKKWKAPLEPVLKERPHVAQLLTDAWWDDGTPREVCTLTVRVGLEQTQLNVNDAENEQSITTTAETLDAALTLLEDALASGRNLWRKWGNFKKKK